MHLSRPCTVVSPSSLALGSDARATFTKTPSLLRHHRVASSHRSPWLSALALLAVPVCSPRPRRMAFHTRRTPRLSTRGREASDSFVFPPPALGIHARASRVPINSVVASSLLSLRRHHSVLFALAFAVGLAHVATPRVRSVAPRSALRTPNGGVDDSLSVIVLTYPVLPTRMFRRKRRSDCVAPTSIATCAAQ